MTFTCRLQLLCAELSLVETASMLEVESRLR